MSASFRARPLIQSGQTNRTEILNDNPLDLLQAAVRGAFCEVGEGVQPTRLPTWASRQFGGDAMLESASRDTSGVRLELDTAATWIEVRLTFTRTWFSFVPFPPRPAVVVVAVEDAEHVFSFDEGDIVHVDEFERTTREHGGSSTVLAQLGGDGTVRPVVVWLPHNCSVELHDLRADADLSPSHRSGLRWVHYGSSISHCLEADTPLGVWPTIAARARDLDLHNLGLAGNALLDGFAARTIRDLEADLITVKVGINVVNSGAFRRRTFVSAVHSFLDTIREGHPDTQLVVISPVSCPVHEDKPGPTEWSATGQLLPTSIPRRPMDGQLTLSDIRQLLNSIVADRSESDRRLGYLDGRELFGAADVDHLPDGLHPDPEGYALMGDRMTHLMQEWLPRSAR